MAGGFFISKNCWNLPFEKVDARSRVLKNLGPVENEGGA